MEILGRARKSQRISENFGIASNPFLGNLNDLWDFWKTSETVQKCFPNVFMILKIFGKSSEIFGSIRKCLENFGNGSKVIFRCFYDFFKIFGKSSEIFGSIRKCLENFGNGSKVIFRCFYDLLKFSENLRKSSEVFENLRKRFPDVIENVRNGSQELKGFGARFWEVLKWTTVDCCAQGMTGK